MHFNIIDIAIITVKGVDYRCIIHDMIDTMTDYIIDTTVLNAPVTCCYDVVLMQLMDTL